MKVNQRTSDNTYFSGHLTRSNTVMRGVIPYQVIAWVQLTPSKRKRIATIRLLAWDYDDALSKVEMECHRKNQTGEKLKFTVKEMI